MNLDDYFILDRMEAMQNAQDNLMKQRVCVCKNALLNPLHAKYCAEFKKAAVLEQKAILKKQYRKTNIYSYLGARNAKT